MTCITAEATRPYCAHVIVRISSAAQPVDSQAARGVNLAPEHYRGYRRSGFNCEFRKHVYYGTVRGRPSQLLDSQFGLT